jgi:hypothetical protein
MRGGAVDIHEARGVINEARPVNAKVRRLGGDPAPTDADMHSVGDSVIGIALENAENNERDRVGAATWDSWDEVKQTKLILQAAADDLDSTTPYQWHARDVLRALDIGAVYDSGALLAVRRRDLLRKI